AGGRIDPADRTLRCTQALHLVEVPPGARVHHQVVAERAAAPDLVHDDATGLGRADLDGVGGPQAGEVGADDRRGAAGGVLQHGDLAAEHVGVPDLLLVAGLRRAIGTAARPDLGDVVGYDVRGRGLP